MAQSARALPIGAVASSRTDALAHLFLLLSRAFSYPSKEEAAYLSSRTFMYDAFSLLELANIEDDHCVQSSLSFCNGAALDADFRAHSLRLEQTRLFMSMPRLIPLEGTKWVKSGGSLAARQSERFAVEAVYRELGLRVRKGSPVPADHIVSELDYAAYVTAAEFQAWQGSDAASAHEWKRLRDEFIDLHLADLAFGLADAIQEKSHNVFLRGHACMLAAVVRSCMP